MYVVFEGVDGTGKSTQIELVKERLDLMFRKSYGVNDVNIITIAEPELEGIEDEEDEIEIALRFALQREILFRKIDSGLYSTPFSEYDKNIVLSDRSYYSSLAYQSKCLTSDFIRNINTFAYEPSLIFFFDKGEPEDFELRRVRDCYLKTLPLSTVKVDTKNFGITQTTEYITEKILSHWDSYFGEE